MNAELDADGSDFLSLPEGPTSIPTGPVRLRVAPCVTGPHRYLSAMGTVVALDAEMAIEQARKSSILQTRKYRRQPAGREL
jgi:hypothetical protein